MASRASASLEPVVSRNSYDDAVGFALRQFVGRGKRFSSCKALEGPSGVPERCIEGARCRPGDEDHRHLPGDKLLSIAGVLGPEFTTLVMAKLIGQAAIWLPGADGLESPREVACDAVDDAAAVNRRLGDNEFSPEDRRELAPVGLRMIACGAALAVAGAA